MPYILAFFKYVIYGSSVFFTGELEESVSVIDILALRFLMSFVFIWLLKTVGVLKIRFGIKEIVMGGERRRLLPTLFLAALFEPVLYMLFETLGISMSSDITCGVVLSLAPIASCIAEALILRERNTLLQKIFLLVGIVGVIYISAKTDTSGGEDSLLGIIFLLLAIVSGSLFAVFSRKSSKAFSAMEITYASAMLGTVIFNAVSVVRHIARGDILSYFDPYFDLHNMIGFVFLAILSTVLATGINNWCLSKMQVSTMAAFSGVSTLVTILIGVIFKGEELYYFHYIGLSLILIRMIGVSVISVRKSRLALFSVSDKEQNMAHK